MGARRTPGEPVPAPLGHTPERLTVSLGRFVELHRAGRHFDAHEELETVWRRSDAAPMPLLQGLIQRAADFEHPRRGNDRGAYRLLTKAWETLRDVPTDDLRLDLSELRRAYPTTIDALAPRERRGRGAPSPEPPIRLIQSPCATSDATTTSRRQG